jgi:hypothetical protein
MAVPTPSKNYMRADDLRKIGHRFCSGFALKTSCLRFGSQSHDAADKGHAVMTATVFEV